MKKTTTFYIDSKKMFDALAEHKKACRKAKREGRPDPILNAYLGECILLLSRKIATKSCFSGYSFLDEMISDGVENCFSRNTKLLTLEHGPVEIGDVVGKQVTVKCNDGVWRPANVRGYGKQKLYEYGFGCRGKRQENIQQKVIATNNHRWFVSTRKGKKKTDIPYNSEVTDLKVGDVLQNGYHLDELDKNAIIHGLVFGDGSGHKGTVYGDPAIVKQGTKYASIRVCKQDVVRDEIVSILESAGYRAQYRPHANGDPIFWIGKFPFVKDVPFTTDPAYIAGFIYGWWLADGQKTRATNRLEITTTDEKAANWLIDHAAYAGYHVLNFYKRERNNNTYANGKPLYMIGLAKSTDYSPRVRYKVEYGTDDVFCVEEPITNSFTLANGLLTGNCIQYGISNFDPSKKANAFSYFTQIIKWAFIRRIQKEKKQQYIKLKNMQNHELHEQLSDNTYSVRNDPEAMNQSDFIRKFEDDITKKKQKRVQPSKALDPFIESPKRVVKVSRTVVKVRAVAKRK